MATYVWRRLSADFSIDLNTLQRTPQGHHILLGCGDGEKNIMWFHVCSATKACFVHIFKLIVSHYLCDGDDETDGMTIANLDLFFGSFDFFLII